MLHSAAGGPCGLRSTQTCQSSHRSRLFTRHPAFQRPLLQHRTLHAVAQPPHSRSTHSPVLLQAGSDAPADAGGAAAQQPMPKDRQSQHQQRRRQADSQSVRQQQQHRVAKLEQQQDTTNSAGDTAPGQAPASRAHTGINRGTRHNQRPKPRQPQNANQGRSNSSSGSSPYDNTRWWVRSSDWKKGAPPLERRPMDVLVVGPHNAPHRHARYMVGKLLTGGKGRVMMLFHGPKTAAKVLSILHSVSFQLQRKYNCTLLCQIGPAEQDAFKMKLIARLWPFAGTWQQPTAAAASRTAADAAHLSRTTAAAGAASNGSGDSNSSAGIAPTSSSSDSGAAASAAAPTSKKPSWLRRGLQGSLPHPSQLPGHVRHLPLFTLPVKVSRLCTHRCSRTTDPRALAGHIATSITQKGRCRVLVAGGLAALNALQAIRSADVMLARAWQQGLVMHVEFVTRTDTGTHLPAPEAAAGAGPIAAAAGGAVGGQSSAGEAPAGVAGPGSAGLGFSGAGELSVPSQQPATVAYYSITLVAANRDWDATPSTCVFPAMRSFSRQQQQPQQQQQQQREEEEGQSGWLKHGVLQGIRHPFGPRNPTFFLVDSSSSGVNQLAGLNSKQLKRLRDFAFSTSADVHGSGTGSDGGNASSSGTDCSRPDGSGLASGGSSSRSSQQRLDLRLGLALDKQLCFWGRCSVAVLGGGKETQGLEVTLAAVAAAMREMHRSSGSTLLWQLSQLQPCPAVPQPPPGSYELQLLRVPRPVQLPSPRFKMLLADDDSSEVALTHAVVWRLIHGLGCASVLIRGPAGVKTALHAVARARSLLRKLYQQDCVVYVSWKPQTQAASAAAPPAAAAYYGDPVGFDIVGRPEAAQQQHHQQDQHAAQAQLDFEQQQQPMQTGLGYQPQAQEQRQAHLQQPQLVLQPPLQQHQQQLDSSATLELPNRLYKLIVLSCNPSDPLDGWKHLKQAQAQPVGRQQQQQQRWLQQQQEESLQRRQERQQRVRKKRLLWFRLHRNNPAKPPP